MNEISHGTFCFASQMIAYQDSTISGIQLLSFTTHRFVILYCNIRDSFRGQIFRTNAKYFFFLINVYLNVILFDDF